MCVCFITIMFNMIMITIAIMIAIMIMIMMIVTMMIVTIARCPAPLCEWSRAHARDALALVRKVSSSAIPSAVQK